MNLLYSSAFMYIGMKFDLATIIFVIYGDRNNKYVYIYMVRGDTRV